MDRTEMESLVKQLKAAGLTEDQIMETFYETFQEGKMDRKDLEAMAEFMGYELTDEFKNDETPDPIAGGEGEGEISKSEAEDLKEIKPGESEEEFKEKIDEAKDETKEDEEKSESEPESEEESEDKEWEEVQKKFNW